MHLAMIFLGFSKEKKNRTNSTISLSNFTYTKQHVIHHSKMCTNTSERRNEGAQYGSDTRSVTKLADCSHYRINDVTYLS